MPTTIVSKTVDEIGLGGMHTLKLINQSFEKIIVSSTGPRYWGFVTGGTAPAVILSK